MAWAGPGVADDEGLIVTGSTLESITVGTVLKLDSELTLPVGEEVVLLPTGGNQTVTLRGPYDGPISEYDMVYPGTVETILERIFVNQAGLADCATVEGGTRAEECD